MVFSCYCRSPCSQNRGSHNEYYHISARLHLSQIILLPSRAWTNIKGNCVILHSCQSITTSGASPPMKSPSPLVHTAIFNDFPKTHWGFSGTVHPSLRVKRDTPFLPLHHAHVLSMGKWRVVCESRGTEPEPEISNVCINDSVAGCSAQNIIYSSHWGEITAAILSRRRKISWPGNT